MKRQDFDDARLPCPACRRPQGSYNSRAQAIGLDQDLGSIEPGKLADLVILDRNPLDDIRNSKPIRYVMRSGRLDDGDTLDQVAPNTRTLPVPWWRDGAPRVAAGIR